MFKKIIATLSCALFLSACGSTNSYAAQPRYTISDTDAQKFLEQEITGHLCLFPNNNGEVPNNLTAAQREALINFRMNNLISVIGEQNAISLLTDTASTKYLHQKGYKLFPTIPRNLLPNKICNNFKQEYNQAVLKAEQFLRDKQAQLAKEEQARQTFYATPEGQAYLAQQRLLQQQQAMQYQQQQMFEQQRMQQEQQARQRAWQDLGNTIQQSAQTLTNTLNQNTQMINNMNNQMMRNNQQMMQNWGNRGGSINCYNLGRITRCNY